MANETPSRRLRNLLVQIQVMGNANAYSLAEEALNILAVMHPIKYAVNDRPITLGEYYAGNGSEDPPGRYYTYDDDPKVVHWMSTGAMVVRCKEIG
jgi:hypothetical protein